MTRTFRLQRRASAVLLVAVMLLAACGGGDDDGGDGGEAAPGDDPAATTPSAPLIVGTDAEPTTLDVQSIDDNGLNLAVWSVNEGLVDFDAEANLVPVLAAELPTQDETDGNRWHVTLREGVSFTDGTPFDAEAVKFNIERMLDPDFGSTLAGDLGSLVGAEVVDEHQVDLVTETPDPLLPNRLRRLRMVSPAAAENGDYAENPVGTGPYVFDSWNRGEDLVLTANEEYWGEPKPEIDRIEIRFIPDANTRLAALEAGEIDIAVNPPDARLPDLGETDGLQLHHTAGGESGLILFNTKEAPYSDVRFRQALNYAIDRELMVEELFGGLYEVQDCNVVSEGVEGYVPELDGTYAYDLDRARSLLGEVDVPDDFTLQFHATSNVYGSDREIGETLASFWRELGLDVEVTFNEIEAFLEVIFDPNRQGIVYGEGSHELNSVIRQIGTYYAEGGEGNALDEATQARLNPLIETAMSPASLEEREEALRAIVTMVCEEALQVFHFHRQDITAMSADLEYGGGFGAFEFANWHLMRRT